MVEALPPNTTYIGLIIYALMFTYSLFDVDQAEVERAAVALRRRTRAEEYSSCIIDVASIHESIMLLSLLSSPFPTTNVFLSHFRLFWARVA